MTPRPAPYDELIDAETWAFIERTIALYPDNATELDLAGQRRAYDDVCSTFDAGRPDGISIEDVTATGPATPIPLRHYKPSHSGGLARVLYLHGGGFILGGLESHDSICAEICAGTGFDVFAVDYRLAPEHLHPAQFEDALAAYRHIAAQSDAPIILCGDSAGGNLAAAIAWACRTDASKPAGQVLIYPALGNDISAGTFVTHAHAPMLTTADMIYYDKLRSDGKVPASDPTFTPLAADDFAHLPPTIVFTAQCDPLAGDGITYCEKLTQAGGKAKCIEETGLVHGYLRARHSVTRAQESFDSIIAAIHALGSGTWPE